MAIFEKGDPFATADSVLEFPIIQDVLEAVYPATAVEWQIHREVPSQRQLVKARRRDLRTGRRRGLRLRGND